MKDWLNALQTSCEIVKKSADIGERHSKVDKMCKLASIMQK